MDGNRASVQIPRRANENVYLHHLQFRTLPPLGIEPTHRFRTSRGLLSPILSHWPGCFALLDLARFACLTRLHYPFLKYTQCRGVFVSVWPHQYIKHLTRKSSIRPRAVLIDRMMSPRD